MPISGGASDKLGNRYEALWVVDQLLQVVEGVATSLTLEPIDPDASRGIEFVVERADGAVQHWSSKRQTAKAAGWTLNMLCKDDQGRSILSDLFEHIARSDNHHGVFASELGAGVLRELAASASSVDFLQKRLERSGDLKQDFEKYILPLCGRSVDLAQTYLQRIHAHATDEDELRRRLDSALSMLFYRPDLSDLDPQAVRLVLGDYLLDHLGRRITQNDIFNALKTHGVHLKDWARDRSVLERVNEVCTTYTAPLASTRIHGKLIDLPTSEPIFNEQGGLQAKRMLIVGSAGAGKSTTLASIVERLQAQGIPVLPIRFDTLPGGLQVTQKLGEAYALPASPSIVLAGIASGGACALVVDQLDAISLASGRRTELWSLFDQLRREVDRIPNMVLLVGCREFDLEHDHRMHALKAQNAGFLTVELGPLTTEQVDAALEDARTSPASVHGSLKRVLSVPLNLFMFLMLAANERVDIDSQDKLFDAYWKVIERRVRDRLDRKPEWARVLDTLTNWLSDHQMLSAPKHVLDDLTEDAAAMASEHVLVLAEGRYRFFHESFFDYAFARRFATRSESFVGVLIGGEQHLFRRAQVRQVLTYLRAHDRDRYLKELEAVLGHDEVRFHIKRFVYRWLSVLPDPERREWDILWMLYGSASPKEAPHVRAVVVNQPAWFDVLDNAGFYEAALSSADQARQDEVIWMFGYSTILEHRPSRVAQLVKKYRRDGEVWIQRVHRLIRSGAVFHSRGMFDFFLSLIDDGTLDEYNPRVAINDNWWSTLTSVATERPNLTCEAIGHWFDRALITWEKAQRSIENPEDQRTSWKNPLSEHLDKNGDAKYQIGEAAKAPLAFAEQMLPRMAQLIAETAQPSKDGLDHDSVWSSRGYNREHYSLHDVLLSHLAQSLEGLARTEPNSVNRLLAPYLNRPHDTLAYLVLRAWTAAPKTYANLIAEYLAADARRLRVGYAYQSTGGGSSKNYISVLAIRACSPLCNAGNHAALEAAILALNVGWETRYPQSRGYTQLELIEALDKSKIGTVTKARWQELCAKFPNEKFEPPVSMGMRRIPSPIAKEAQAKMSDDHWLQAMVKYAGVGLRADQTFSLDGGKCQLAQDLQAQAKTDPVRFAALTARMPDTLSGIFFDSIVHGVADSYGTSATIPLENIVALLMHVFALPGRPCGKATAWLVQKWKDCDWPDAVLDIVAWHAMHDLDPKEETWTVLASGGTAYSNGDPYTAGINSTRGAAAKAIGRLLFDKYARFGRLQHAIDSLVHNSSTAVRSCTLLALIAVLSIDVPKAVAWFKECVGGDSAILATPHVSQFIHYAGRDDYAGLRPVLDAMLASSDEKVVDAVAEQICLLGLYVELANTVHPDVERVHRGSVAMRKAAAEVYAHHIDDETVGETCRRNLMPFLQDPDEEVRTKAASALYRLKKLSMQEQSELLEAFLDGKPGLEALNSAVHALEDSPVELPDLVFRLAEECVRTCQYEAGNITKAAGMIGWNLSKIVVRLYAQKEANPAMQARCLDLIDQMELYDFVGLDDELKRVER